MFDNIGIIKHKGYKGDLLFKYKQFLFLSTPIPGKMTLFYQIKTKIKRLFL